MAKIVRALIFALMVIALVVVLKILGWLPLAINKDSIRAYHSIDEMVDEIRIGHTYKGRIYKICISRGIIRSNRPYNILLQ